MQPLTYSDRSEMLRIVDSLRGASPADEEIARATSQLLTSHIKAAGIEYALTRNALALCYYLLYGQDESVRKSARGALLYLTYKNDLFPDDAPGIGLQDDHYVLGLAVHEITGLAGIQPLHTGPVLIPPHKSDIETWLGLYRDEPIGDDDFLSDRADRTLASLESVLASGFLGRFRRNVEDLICVMTDPAASTDALSWARAGLSYLAEPQDVIDDGLGLVGLLDDIYAVAIAARNAVPGMADLAGALDTVVQRWPFLSRLVLQDGGTLRELSEFTLCNAGVLQQMVGGAQGSPGQALIVPTTGPASFMLGLLSSIALAAAPQDGQSQPAFETGDRVFVDNTGTVRIFDGFREINGRRMFGIRRGEAVRLWPATPENLARIRPAGERAVRGQIVPQVATLISPLDRLLHAEQPIALHNMRHRVVVVSQVSAARRLAENTRLYGQRLRDLLPMGHVSQDGEPRSWSSQWQATTPLLLFAPDLTTACELIEDGLGEECDLVVMDQAFSWPRQSANLQRLARNKLKMLAIAPEAAGDGIREASRCGFELAEWTETELGSVIWHPPAEGDGPLARHEQALSEVVQSRVAAETIECAEASDAFRHLYALRAAARGRSEAEDLEQIVAVAWKAINELSQWLATIPPGSPLAERTVSRINFLQDPPGAMFLPDHDLDRCRAVAGAVRAFMGILRRSNPKLDRLLELSLGGEDVIVVCRPSFPATELQAALRTELTQRLGSRQARSIEVMCPAQAPADRRLDNVIVPGWLNATNMTRILRPPLGRNTVLLLYDAEAEAHAKFRKDEAAAHRQRRARSVTAAVRGEKAPDVPPASPQVPPLPELDELDQLVASAAKRRAVEQAQGVAGEQTVPARLVWFIEGRHAWMTESHYAKRVNHLISGAVDDPENAQVELVPRDDLVPGDFLLFHTGSDSDAIRVVADQILRDPSIRHTASLWRPALERFRAERGLTIGQLQKELHKHGCKRHWVTIHTWLDYDHIIAPRSYEDIKAIADTTGDATLRDKLQECNEAVSRVRGSHLQASSVLAKRVIHAFAQQAAEVGSAELVLGATDLGDSLVVVRVASMDEEELPVRRLMVNRLLEDAADGADAADSHTS